MNETPSMDGEILKALVGKVGDLARSVKDNADQTKGLVEHLEEIRGLKEQMGVLERKAEELVSKNAGVEAAMQQAVGEMNLPVEKVERLQVALDHQVKIFQQPLDKTVRHHHFIGKVFWILFVLILISSGVSMMMVWQWQRADRYAADQIRWRAVKLITDTVVTKVVDRVESASEADPKGFAREIEAEEDRREDLMKNMLREQEARRRIDELERQKAGK